MNVILILIVETSLTNMDFSIRKKKWAKKDEKQALFCSKAKSFDEEDNIFFYQPLNGKNSECAAYYSIDSRAVQTVFLVEWSK